MNPLAEVNGGTVRSSELLPLPSRTRSELQLPYAEALQAAALAAGSRLMIAFADRGELFVWGKNVRGCLGIGKRDDQFFPWRVRQHGTLDFTQTNKMV